MVSKLKLPPSLMEDAERALDEMFEIVGKDPEKLAMLERELKQLARDVRALKR
jgi:hypothetical protein